MDESKEYIDGMEVEEAQDVSVSIYRTKPRRAKVAMKVKQRKSKFMGCTCHLKYYNRSSLSTSSNIQDLIPSIPCHAIFVFLNPILIGVLQVEYQNKKESPFDTHPLQKHTFLTCICFYGALLGIKIHTKSYKKCYRQVILSYGLLLSGVFSSVSLLSILLKQHHLLWIVLTIWGSIPIILAHRVLKSSVCWIMKMFAKLTWGAFKNSSTSGSNDICPRVEGI